MDLNDEMKRREIISVYRNSERWKEKVDKMSSEQVTAVYLRFQREGKLR